ncbi:hypothetical protein GFY24_12085 [Nocardia sp. SYP-A9097]|uniref:hypothetical protein n=1 Tax=Nocardia sp. SYP-A9097 TaxID=2663237 RepID=UPI00129AC239|nr:hypothetical protein [Nocardia sp. SYP-A9097]MRH88173.1 hypothetical protein [Nocardia sp. SYP-A9097]
MDPNILSVWTGLGVGLVVDTVYGFLTAIYPYVGDGLGSVQHPECVLGTLSAGTTCIR